MFERGFKTWCEKRALEIRKELKLKQHEKLDPRLLAQHLNVRVWKVEDVPSLTAGSRNLLLGTGADDWSAVTLIEGDRKLIILNSSHSEGRLSNDLAHELAHIILEHVPQELAMTPDGICLRQHHDLLQEQQADWLAASLLLPRPALVFIKKTFSDLQSAASQYGVSKRLLDYRLAVTGVRNQYQ